MPAEKDERLQLRQQAYLYRDEFLTGFPETDAALFEEWVLQQREYYRRLAFDALQRLAEDALERADPVPGIEDARRALELDPFREETYRLLMQLYARSGNVVAALRQYDDCVHVLDAELGVPPDMKTIALAQALRDDRRMSEASAHVTPIFMASETSIPNNLPATMTPLIGRDVELSSLEELMASDDARLVSIVGLAGTGKTRLSLAAAQRQVDTGHFAQGAFFVELAPLAGSGHIVNAVAEALRLPLKIDVGNRRTPIQQVTDYLRTKEILLVLDNFEHLLEETGIVIEILQAAVGVKVLVTSRERLRLPGEQVFPLHGLDYANEAQRDVATVPAAAQLFVETAQRSSPDFTVAREQMVQVVDICRLIEGLPLAIELAATWVELLTLDEIVDELHCSLEFLETEQRGGPVRHRSLRAAFDSTWQGLEKPLQSIFARLSVFRGGFTRTAAEQVTGASLAQLRTLINKSLIQFDRKRNRYALHEMLRQYGAERLTNDPEREEDVCRRHSVYFCSMAYHRGNELLGTRQMEAIAELDREAGNLRVAWHWVILHQDWDLAEKAMDGLGFFHEWQGRIQDGEAAFQTAVDALRADDDTDLQSILAQASAWCSVFADGQGRASEAEHLLVEALRLLQQGRPDNEELLAKQAFAWLRRGIQSYNYDDQRSRDGFANSLELYQRVEHKWGIARALSGLGQADADDGNYMEAGSRFRAALDLLREIGDRRSEAHILHRLAITLRNAGSYEEALTLARLSQRLYLEMEDHAGIAWSNQILAECLFAVGAYEDALDNLRNAEAVATELADSSRLANVYHIQALVFLSLGRYQEASSRGEAGLSLARQLGQLLRIAWCQLMLVFVNLHDGEYGVAEQRLEESERMLASQHRKHELALVQGLQTLIEVARQDRVRARECALDSLRLSLEYHDIRLGAALGALTRVLIDAGQDEDALAVLGHMLKNPMGAAFALLLRPRLALVKDQMSPDNVDEAMARYQDADVWNLVEMWISDLEEMGDV